MTLPVRGRHLDIDFLQSLRIDQIDAVEGERLKGRVVQHDRVLQEAVLRLHPTQGGAIGADVQGIIIETVGDESRCIILGRRVTVGRERSIAVLLSRASLLIFACRVDVEGVLLRRPASCDAGDEEGTHRETDQSMLRCAHTRTTPDGEEVPGEAQDTDQCDSNHTPRGLGSIIRSGPEIWGVDTRPCWREEAGSGTR